MDDVTAIGEERSAEERREITLKTFIYGYFRSRRRGSRRQDEADGPLTDFHHPWLFFLSIGIMLLSCTDAFLTLRLLDIGAVELNPFMAWMISESTLLFAATKVSLTGMGVMLLVFASRTHLFERFRVGLLLTLFFCFYASLVCYEFINLISER
jgi:hypothetical protein